jgi:hypothetical protein
MINFEPIRYEEKSTDPWDRYGFIFFSAALRFGVFSVFYTFFRRKIRKKRRFTPFFGPHINNREILAPLAAGASPVLCLKQLGELSDALRSLCKSLGFTWHQGER